ncbi:membrane integrity-associated transporter subunit PqiC [Pseudomonas sp. UL073]|uniref:Membrane integrity-associated transporter subunit PqiC n=1 Tax=Zestomonas insulae TaxID=2809017 RepID=A0ABS2IDN4_9GAMM|nr:ABC-type transport auxiliary lipoprotein family protein [Pseudomonas insulae]MBM7061211.1 membrane integrity-associated transporter subunit PqiC [Pseudomonas insulae]
MSVLRLPMVLLLTGVLGLVGCVGYKPVPLYKLDSGNPGVPSQKGGPAILLGPVTVADYLQREVLLQRQPDGSLLPSEHDRWAGSLTADIDQVLLRQLAWRLNTQRLVLAPAAAGFSADMQVQLTISRLDSGPQQPAVLEAEWRVLDKRGQLRDSRMVRVQEDHLGTAADQVRAQSVVLQRLAEQLAENVQPLLLQEQQAPVAEVPRKPAPSAPERAKEPAEPKIPMAAPVRTDVEVFRF